jgi:hypothetical protein
MEKEVLYPSVAPWECRTMKAHHYDIVRKDGNKLMWLEDAADLGSAELRIQQLTSFWPGEFQVMDQQNHRLVAVNSDSRHMRVAVQNET